MTYMSRNPQVASVVLDDITTTTPGNPPSGKHKLVDRNGTMFIRDASGAEVALGTTASVGSGEKNYISNPSGAAATTGWETYGDLTLSRTTTVSELPRENTTKTGIKIIADADTQGTGDIVYFNFTLDDVDLGRFMKIKFDVKSLATYDGKLQCYVATAADVATQVAGGAVAPAISGFTTTAIPGTDGTFTIYFVSGSTAALSLVIQASADMTTGDGITISDVVVGPNVQVQGSAIGAWKTFTPTGSWTSNTSYLGKYREVGGSLEIHYNIGCSAAPTSATLTLDMPSGFTVDSTRLPNGAASHVAGTWRARDSGVQSYGGSVEINGANSSTAVFSPIISAAGYMTQAAPFTFGNGDTVQVFVTVPVNELSSNVTLANRALEVYGANSNTTTATASDSSSFVSGPAGTLGITTTPGATITRDVEFYSANQATDSFITEVSTDRIVWKQVPCVVGSGTSLLEPFGAYGSSTSGISQPEYISGQPTRVRVSFGVYRTSDNDTWAGLSTWYWRVRRVSGGASVGYPISSANIVGRTDGVAPAAGNIGEIITSSQTSAINTGATTVYSDLLTLTLTAGTWDISAAIFVSLNSSTFTAWDGGIGTASGNNTTGFVSGLNTIEGPIPTSAVNASGVVPVWRVSPSSTTTYYLKLRCTFSAGQPQWRGNIQGIRRA